MNNLLTHKNLIKQGFVVSSLISFVIRMVSPTMGCHSFIIVLNSPVYYQIENERATEYLK